MRTWRSLVSAFCLVAATAAWAADAFLVEDWSRHLVGAKGIPQGWEGQSWGSPGYEFSVVEDGGVKALHLKSQGDGSTITKSIKGKVNLKETPILEWRWKVVVLPKGGDVRQKETDDQAAQVYVGWERFPREIRSRFIGYVWDTTAPAGTTAKSQKTGTVHYLVVRSGPAELGKWITERRNVLQDFKLIYGALDAGPDLVSLGIDSNDTKSSAESFIGSLAFKRER